MKKIQSYASELKWLACAFYLTLSLNGRSQTDQEIIYGSYLGGFAVDALTGIEKSATGYWLVGNTTSLNFPVTPDAFFTSPRGQDDITVTHVNTALSEITYSSYLGGIGIDFGDLSAISNTGILAVAGFTNSINFPTEGIYAIEEKPGGLDAFITVFNSSGVVLWSTYFGGQGNDGIRSMKYDNEGNLFVVGFSSSTTLGTSGAYLETPQSTAPAADGFICKFAPSGEKLWFSYYGGALGSVISEIEISENGRVYFVGSTYSEGLASTGAFQESNAGLSDWIIGEINQESIPVWLTYYGGSQDDASHRLVSLGNSDLFIAGKVSSMDVIGLGNAFQPNYGGGDADLFLTRFSADGNHIWSSYYGGSSFEPDCVRIAMESDNFGNICLVTDTSSPNSLVYGSDPFDFEPPTNFSSKGLIAKISSVTNLPIWSTYFIDGCSISDFTIDSDNNIVGVGGFNLEDQQYITNDAVQPNYGGGPIDGAIIVIQDNVVTATKDRQNLEFQIYPNPTSGKFQIESPGLLDRVEIYDQLGKKVFENRPNASQWELDISNLPSGMYLVRAESEGFVGSTKIIKE